MTRPTGRVIQEAIDHWQSRAEKAEAQVAAAHAWLRDEWERWFRACSCVHSGGGVFAPCGACSEAKRFRSILSDLSSAAEAYRQSVRREALLEAAAIARNFMVESNPEKDCNDPWTAREIATCIEALASKEPAR